jgi:hypothetical protein
VILARHWHQIHAIQGWYSPAGDTSPMTVLANNNLPIAVRLKVLLLFFIIA